MKKNYLFFLLFISFTSGLTTVAQEKTEVKKDMDYYQNYLNEHIGKRMPDWVLRDLNNKEQSSKELNGKIVLLNFWGVGCGACIMIHKDLVSLQTAYKDKEFILINVEGDERADTAEIRKFLVARKLFDNTLFKGKDLGLKMGAAGAMPTLILVDKTGKIVYGHIGYFYGDTKQKMIEQINKL